MRKLLVFQHVPLEPLGTLNQQFKDAGFRIRYINFDREPNASVDVSRYHGLVVLGGPMAANQTERYAHLAAEQDMIRSAVALGMPVLGICLGAQLIAAAFGGRTLRGAAPEYGWVSVRPTAAAKDDPLLKFFSAEESVYQWHSDTFTLPHAALHLAESDDCAFQAFRLYDHVYGLQFHLEADRRLIERWVTTAGHVEQAERSGVSISRARTLAQCDNYLPRAHELAHSVFDAFIQRFYGFRRRLAHVSR